MRVRVRVRSKVRVRAKVGVRVRVRVRVRAQGEDMHGRDGRCALTPLRTEASGGGARVRRRASSGGTSWRSGRRGLR